MNAVTLRKALRLVSIVALCSASIANAALFRTYLSFQGSDANPCTVQLPCRLLPAALAATNDGGEIWMLDSANYNTGPVIINKGVKIFAIPGALGSLVGNGGDAVIINTAGDVTLRNVQILNLNAGVNGVTIQAAGGVHLEKVSVDGFTNVSAACIRLDSTTTVRLYVDDSFLRHCNIGIYANGTATSNLSSVLVDNTRIERGFSTTPPSYGIWMQGAIDVSLRNSVISRQDEAIHFENPIVSSSKLYLDHSEITRSTAGIVYSNNFTNGVGTIHLKNSFFVSNTDQLIVSNSAVGGNVLITVVDSQFSNSGNNLFTLSNSAADAGGNTRVFLEMVRSQVKSTGNVAVSLSATNGGKTYLYARDSEIAHAGTGIKTAGSGTGGISISLVRSQIMHTTTAIDHGFGAVRLDGSHVVNNSNDFVNSGSGAITSLGNNMVVDNTNTSGFTYITPSIIAPK